MSNNESLGKLAKEAAKGVARIPLQATKTVAKVTNHSLKGVEKASKTNTQDYTQAGAIASGNAWGTGGQALFSIGSSNYSTGLDCFNGYIDEVHISNIARYTSSFTPPTARVLPDNYTTSYDNFDTPIPSNSGVIQYTGKTATSFTGCSHYRGSTTIASGSEIIPFSPV